MDLGCQNFNLGGLDSPWKDKKFKAYQHGLITLSFYKRAKSKIQKVMSNKTKENLRFFLCKMKVVDFEKYCEFSDSIKTFEE